MNVNQSLANKVIILAGAGGISSAVARALGARGATVVVSDLELEAAENAAQLAREAGGTASTVAVDIANEAQVASLIDNAVSEFGRLDGLFNVAADLSPENIGRDSNPVDMPVDVWRRTLDVNLTGYMLTIRYAIPHLVACGGGAIVNTLSAAAYIGEPDRVAYAVAKAGCGALTRHVARRWGNEGIRCNAVAPGMVLTPSALASMPQDALDGLLAVLPSTRLGRPEDVAAMVAHLFSDDGAWINGQSISVDGGMTMRP
jgi:NAD(P)-dependent dehydrogenase (short-subunit alcohol dehydrogenase family)